MDYLERINNAVSYIENKLKNNIQLEDVARNACFSKYHFIRIFQAVTGETVWSYVRKRRLTKAARDLIDTNQRILDIAFDYQFESPESFNRSFKAMYHQTPGQYRKKQTNQIAFSRARLTNRRLKHLESGIKNLPKVVETKNIRVVGLAGRTKLSDNQLYNLWNLFLQRINELKYLKKPVTYYEVHPFESNLDLTEYTEDTMFTKIAAAGVTQISNLPGEMIAREIKPGKYAVFTHVGSISNIQMSYDYIWGTWVVGASEVIDERDDFELYEEHRFKGLNHPETEIDIYIPIK